MYAQEKIKPYEGNAHKREQVEQLFDNIAPTYDTLNHTLSFGQDVKSLMEASWGFHDGIIEKIGYDIESASVEVAFSGCWGGKVTLRFQQDPMAHFSFGDMFDGMIADSNVFFENGFVYWVDDYAIKTEADLAKAKDALYFRARALCWKMETEYRSPEEAAFFD